VAAAAHGPCRPRRTTGKTLGDPAAHGDACPWREVDDEYTGSANQFHERHYNEFVTFLPYVQQFLYGEGRAARGLGSKASESPMRVFRRTDVRHARMRLRPDEAPITLDIVHVDLYFFSMSTWYFSRQK
jgi:hypothetical protein